MTSASFGPGVATPPVWYGAADCDLEAFRAVVEQPTRPEDHPLAERVVDNVPVYGGRLVGALADAAGRRPAQAELARTLGAGPGIVVVEGALDAAVVERAGAVFRTLVAEQRAAGGPGGDHFAPPGSNDRVWGAFDKLALRDPEAFADYYANDLLAAVSEAWLGPAYRITSQVNVVNPGGRAQTAHRDYHLGFMDRDRAAAWPAQAHALSPALTLQGAVAHVDMPVETGPTMYLPHSQKYPAGYVAFHDPEFGRYFDQHHVQLPLATGDAVFFNPALFHAAGTNATAHVRRMANLLQVSSAFGRPMEAVDTVAVALAVYPVLRRRRAAGAGRRWLANVVAAVAEGYPFPTNLDRDQPVGGLTPPSEADLLARALEESWAPDHLEGELEAGRRRRRPGATT